MVDVEWIAELGIHYKLGVDGLNLFLIALTAIVWVAAVLAAGFKAWERPRAFFFWLGLAETAVLGALVAQDLLLFVAFFDLMLIPFVFLTGQWGGRDRVAATIKFVIYTLVGSLLMLAAAIADRRALHARRTGRSPSRSPTSRRTGSARARRTGSSCSSPPPSW